MIRGLISIFDFNYPRVLIYMLQSTEYEVWPYITWFWRTKNFNTVARRRTLDPTPRAKLLLFVLRLGMAIQYLLSAGIILYAYQQHSVLWLEFGIVLLLACPILWAHLIVLPLLLARLFIVGPKDRRMIARSKTIFANHPGLKIAVAGSYGKTTVKELLLTILSEGKEVAATPANKNVAVSHAQWAHKLSGKEDILIIELGEGKPGDVERFADTIQPNIGVITGLAPAHLDKYRTLKNAANDIFSLSTSVGADKTYVNGESADIKGYIQSGNHVYSDAGVSGWSVSGVSVEVNGLSFTMHKAGKTLELTSKLVGRHLIGPLAACVAIADEVGLTPEQIESGVAKTAPFEHRMQPRPLAGGWIIDDTYNGNLEGTRAGLALLKELTAKRKIYVTPGLVDQGSQAERVHKELGELIAKSNPDKVVLMKNSATDWILYGLRVRNFSGEVVVEDDPLGFYTNLDQMIAVGDVVLMQNDWTDNYN